ncbi:MAG: phosphoserine transaminase [Thermoflexibacter sp.]
MLYFYPGPSKLYPTVRQYLSDAYDSGILSLNHRSPEFVNLSKSAICLLKEKLHIPQAYTIFFVSSATESWEIIAQSLSPQGSLHIFNGAFGQKWYEYTLKINEKAQSFPFGLDEEINIHCLPTLEIDTVCLTQNETSNGTQVSNETIAQISKKYQNSLIALDATSSLGGIEINWQHADITFASVQKCFGLPAGLGIMVCSPKTIRKGLEINEKKYYNSFTFLYENMQNWQTNYTPNVLNIYLLNRVLNDALPIDVISKQTKEKAKNWYDFLEKSYFSILGKNPNTRSDTVIAVQGEENFIKAIKEKAKNQGIILGNGYGKWKNNTFRIANFPAITQEEIEVLQDFLEKFISQEVSN